ncbi:MAG: hypothetical protein LAQ69_08585 [Acidobacteriia bacterium]|nr:hypothetical protein [Terriglobia bacterium]
MLVFFVVIIGLLGTFVLAAAGLTYIVVAVADRHACPVRVPATMLLGYVAGLLFVWILVPRNWTLPFWTTLAATVNAAKYGHPVEHAAEGIVIWMMLGAVVGSFVGGSVAHLVGEFLRRRRVVQAH